VVSGAKEKHFVVVFHSETSNDLVDVQPAEDAMRIDMEDGAFPVHELAVDPR
jgi:hypothetical protein